MSVTDSQELSNYNEAFKLLKENPPEQRLDVQLPFDMFLQLDEALSNLKSTAGISEDQRYPSLGYNSHTETVTVVTCPSSIHERAARWIDSEFSQFVKAYLSTHSPHTVGNIGLVGSTTKHFSDAVYAQSRKEPDGGFIYETVDAAYSRLVIAVEVGYSEVRDKLHDDKDMWINGRGVNVVILVFFKEKPRFKHPTTSRHRDITDRLAEMAVMSRAVGETAQSSMQRRYYGPLRYRGHAWIGELNEVYIEVWRRHGPPNTINLIHEGFARPLADIPNTLGLWIRDFYPNDVWALEAANIEDKEIPFDGASFLDGLRRASTTAAMDRFEGFLFDKLGLR
ncbi:hypothetical protein V1505DRAFT_315729 [Lipomyces doorenjongii]